jgi:DNA-binding transcriptional regulator YiaG
MSRQVLDEYEDDLIGIGNPVTLINAVYEERCEACGFTQKVIPDLDGLIAAVAASRALHPLKLRGEEIKFMRKALEVSAKDLAALMNVAPETISRWENNREPIAPGTEKFLRLLVAGLLREKAPEIDCGVDVTGEIAKMKIAPVCSEKGKPLMCFERTKVRFAPSKGTVTRWDRSVDEAA